MNKSWEFYARRPTLQETLKDVLKLKEVKWDEKWGGSGRRAPALGGRKRLPVSSPLPFLISYLLVLFPAGFEMCYKSRLVWSHIELTKEKQREQNLAIFRIKSTSTKMGFKFPCGQRNALLRPWDKLCGLSTDVSTWNRWKGRGYVGVPCFVKVCVTPLCFCERFMLVPVFANRRKSRKCFCSYKKRQKAKIAFRAGSAASRPRGSAHPPAPSSFPGASLGMLASSRRALSCVWEHLGFISIDFVRLLARCVTKA